jgi:hypothetical protein
VSFAKPRSGIATDPLSIILYPKTLFFLFFFEEKSIDKGASPAIAKLAGTL